MFKSNILLSAGILLAFAALALWLTSYRVVIPQVFTIAAVAFIAAGLARQYMHTRPPRKNIRRFHH